MCSTSVAVLTGDLVASTKRSSGQIDAAMLAISKAATTVATWQVPQQDTRFTRYRGDGWQMVLSEPRLALRAAVVIQGRLIALGLESRIFIGVGPVESLGSADLANAAGKAFEISGQGLDNMGSTWRLDINGEGIVEQDRMIADLMGERMGRWTAPQAEAAAMQLASPRRIRTLFDIGTELDISPQAVNDRLRGAGCHVIASVLRRWEGLPGRVHWGQPDA
jgi:hypothetical protein